jgi:hypothetical protein
MDEHWIDRSARWLGRGLSRRRAVGGSAGLVAALATGVSARAQEATPSPAAATAGTVPPFALAACLGFAATVVSGPNSGAKWQGDLIMQVGSDSFFSGMLASPGAVDEAQLRVTDPAKVLAEASGQIAGAAIDWFLYLADGRVVFGHGLVDVRSQQWRGTIGGPDPADVGVFQGRAFPPYHRVLLDSVCCLERCATDESGKTTCSCLHSVPVGMSC